MKTLNEIQIDSISGEFAESKLNVQYVDFIISFVQGAFELGITTLQIINGHHPKKDSRNEYSIW